MEKRNVARIGVSLPPVLLNKFDLMIGGMGYANRSEAIRDAIREYILKNELKNEKGEIVGVISIIYDHNTRGVNDVLTGLQHEHHRVIQSTIHLHLDKHSCMELIIVRGKFNGVKEVRDRLISVRGVKQSDMLLTDSTDY